MSLTDSSFNLELELEIAGQCTVFSKGYRLCFRYGYLPYLNRVLINQRHSRLWRGAIYRFKVKTFLITY